MLKHLQKNVLQMFSQHLCKSFSVKHLQNILEVVTCKITHSKLKHFANVLQMFYFTCNHGLIPDTGRATSSVEPFRLSMLGEKV